MTNATAIPPRWGKFTPVAAIFTVIVIFDQITKFITRARLDIGEIWPDWPVRFTHVKNTGSAFGLFDGQALFLIIGSLIAIGVMLCFFRQAAASSLLVRIALGMMLGGAISNLADRIRDGNVTDMIEFPHYPVFNVADSAVVIGIVILGFVIVFQSNPGARPEPDEGRPGPTSESPS